ncbi:MAG: HAD family hydrolase [Planctomycetia bacterium]
MAGLCAVVFDLDDTLYDAFTQCVRPAQREAAEAMRRAGLRAPLEAIVALREALAGAPLDLDEEVARSFPCSDPQAVARAGRAAFLVRDPGALSPHPFAREVLLAVRARAQAVLLTAGHPPTQQAKLARLGLGDLLDPQLWVDPARGQAKAGVLGAWLAQSGLPAAQVLVVGDRPAAEIAAARALGCPALRIRAGECAGQPTPAGVQEAADIRAVLAWLEGPCPPCGEAAPGR